jgi:hypothetical protein
MGRPVQKCTNCGESREMAAHGVCFRCYRQQQREAEGSPWMEINKADRHNRALLKLQKKWRIAITCTINAIDHDLVDLLTEDERADVRRVLQPHVDRLFQLPASKPPTELVNGEPESKTVNSEQ